MQLRGDHSLRTENVRLPEIGFDHAVASNWFRPIAIAFHEKGQNFATVDNLVDLTFRSIGVLTRGRPRQILAQSIRKAIKALAKNGTFDMYRPDRVRLKDQTRLDRYRLQPSPISAPLFELKRTPPERFGTGAQQQSSERSGMSVGDLFESITKAPALLQLRPLRNTASDTLNHESHNTTEATDLDELEEEEKRLLEAILDESDVESTRAPDFGLHTEESPERHQGDLIDRLLALLRRISGIKIGRFERGVRGTLDELRLTIESRLDGEIRLRILGPEAFVRLTLSENQRAWYLAPIGLSANGELVIMRSWPEGTRADVIAAQTLADIQFVRDAIANEA